MSKQVKGEIKLTVPACGATPAPPLGPALGQRKVNIPDFCKKFNDATQSTEKGTPLPTVITIYEDNSYSFIVKTPPASFYLKKFAKIQKGAKTTKKEPFIGVVTMDDCREIARLKLQDLNTNDIEAGARIICGSAASIGIEVKGK